MEIDTNMFVYDAMIEFAKLHVKAALEVANSWENSGELAPEIENAYPYDNIR